MVFPLEGVRVIELTVFEVGPAGTAFLADLGADVIHVEEPGLGDPQRSMDAFMGLDMRFPDGRNMIFEEHNRNKRGIVVDLKKERGREVLYRLVAKSDVFVTNLRPVGVAKLGMDYPTLRQHNPRLIYAQATGFGPRGPDGNSPSLDILAEARSGLMLGSGEEGMPPIHVPSGVGDRTTSLTLAFGIMSALFIRERLGIGQEINVSQLCSLLTVQAALLTVLPLWTGRNLPRQVRARARNPLYNWYRCGDGRWLALAAQFEWNWPALCRALGRPELERDPRFQDEPSRDRHCQELVAILDEVFASRSSLEWQQRLKAADVLFALVNTPLEAVSDPQVLANEYVRDWDHPTLGRLKFLGFPVQFAQTPATLRTGAPGLGQHTEEVLTQVAGYAQKELARLREEGVIP